MQFLWRKYDCVHLDLVFLSDIGRHCPAILLSRAFAFFKDLLQFVFGIRKVLDEFRGEVDAV